MQLTVPDQVPSSPCTRQGPANNQTKSHPHLRCIHRSHLSEKKDPDTGYIEGPLTAVCSDNQNRISFSNLEKHKQPTRYIKIKTANQKKMRQQRNMFQKTE